MNKTLIRIGAYSRVSTQEQEKLDDKFSEITDYVEQNYSSEEYSIEYYSDSGYSGNTIDRPSYIGKETFSIKVKNINQGCVGEIDMGSLNYY